jgi:hypothetical protein
MRILDQMGYASEFTQGLDVSGREFLVLVTRATFDFPQHPGDIAPRSATQVPPVMADEATGAPGFSAVRWETDFAHRKRRCDVILNGAAHAPGGVPAPRVRVGLRVGTWTKSFDVVGHREWRSVGVAWAATEPVPFRRLDFGYDTAFGGTDRLDPDDRAPPAYRLNPVGRGWADPRNAARVPGLPLPNTEAADEPVTSPHGRYRPMAFGPWGRGWPGRIEHAGTYDQAWVDSVFPFLPADFDERYYQSAPPDQQIDPPPAGTEVLLVNLTPEGKTWFRLPDTALPVTVFRDGAPVLDSRLLPDTLLLDPEHRRLSLVWRCEVRIRRIITEFDEAWIGPPTAAMLRARAEGKAYVRDVATAADEPA